jgi:uncharacterized protein YeaO (DUF488 family)
MVKTKRVYDEVGKDDGIRVLVDRLWPRGLKKESIKIKLWLKQIAPSNELRKWFSHDPSRWRGFCKRYKQELIRDEEKKKTLMHLVEIAGSEDFTLVYGAKDKEHNNAQALKEFIENLLKTS